MYTGATMSMQNFPATNMTLRQLLGNGLVYRVPMFQRDYSWTQDEWEELWQDINNVTEGHEKAHYMGYLVLQTQDQKEFNIIDGQQRLVTLSILVLSALSVLERLTHLDDDNARRAEQLRSIFIGYLDPVTLVSRPKLTLNRNDDGFYRDKLVTFQKLSYKGLTTSEKLLADCFQWFAKKIAEDPKISHSGSGIANFLINISDSLFFTAITVADELNAFKVFETLNARGVRLSPTDLLKNYLFSVVYRENTHPAEMNDLERRWNRIVSDLEGESFSGFLRTYWNSREQLVRESALFKTLRSHVSNRGAVFLLLRDLEFDIDQYIALNEPENSTWDDNQRQFIRELSMFSVKQPWSLLLAVIRKFDPQQVAEVLRAISIVSFRYNVIGNLSSGEQERIYNDIARRVNSGEFTSPREVILGLSPMYPKDESFRTAFAEKILDTKTGRNKRIARYILFTLEKHKTGLSFDQDDPKYTLEHILPENPGEDWAWSDRNRDQGTYRLGNFTLLEASINRNLGNQGFVAKKTGYSQSGFSLTQAIAEHNAEWSYERLAERQRQMAKLAQAIWHLPQLA
jgi:hypothetical protein